MNIIGIGEAGCKIANCFGQYDQYKIFSIDTDNKSYENFLAVKEQNSHELYESNYQKLNLKDCIGETTLILSGVGDISGCVLRVLQQIKKQKIDVIYIKCTERQLTKEQAIKDKIVFGVLQEYARSNVIGNMYVVSNKSVENILPDISIQNYWKDINNFISNTYHMINVFQRAEPLLSSALNKKETVCIGTFGVVDFKTGNERLFYDIEYPRAKNFYYNINEETLKDKELLHTIRKRTDDLQGDSVTVGFSIYPTTYEHNYVYSTCYASYVQEQKF